MVKALKFVTVTYYEASVMDDNFLSIQDFTVVPMKYANESQETHYLYVKEDTGKDLLECKPKGRTLFVLNIPPYVTEACLERMFRSCGKITAVYIHKKPTRTTLRQEESEFFKTHPPVEGFKVAYIVFKNPSGIEKAKKLPFEEPRIMTSEKFPLKLGVKKWCADYVRSSRCDVNKLQHEVNQYMEDFDKKQKEEEELSKDEEPDEDGWVTVTRHSKNKAIPRTEAMETKITRRQKKKLKEKELLNFYAFQIRETKREHIAELRKKFEEDKQRISLMKAQRKFKPY